MCEMQTKSNCCLTNIYKQIAALAITIFKNSNSANHSSENDISLTNHKSNIVGTYPFHQESFNLWFACLKDGQVLYSWKFHCKKPVEMAQDSFL